MNPCSVLTSNTGTTRLLTLFLFSLFALACGESGSEQAEDLQPPTSSSPGARSSP